MDATGTDCAVLIGNSLGGEVAPLLAHRCPERVGGLVLIGPSAPIGPQGVKWNYDEFLGERATYERYDKWNAAYWKRHYRDFSEEFLGSCFSERHSTKQIEDAVSWSLETTPEVLIDTVLGYGSGSGASEAMYRQLTCPVLLIQGPRTRSSRSSAAGSWPNSAAANSSRSPARGTFPKGASRPRSTF